jgi:hypothetical protein
MVSLLRYKFKNFCVGFTLLLEETKETDVNFFHTLYWMVLICGVNYKLFYSFDKQKLTQLFILLNFL